MPILRLLMLLSIIIHLWANEKRQSNCARLGKNKRPNPSKVQSFMEAPPGFEPGNQGFADPCLTTWLWRHRRLQELLSSKNSCQKTGADDEARTRYLHLGKVALYQMSYIRKWCLRSESNQRHGDFQSPALPTELHRQIGDPDEARTHDL